MAHKALLTGGGSGGHVFPALAIGDELRQRGFEVSFAGRPQSLEARVFSASGHDFHALDAKPLLGRGWIDRLLGLWTLGRSTLRARALLRRLRSEVVVATGGYVCAPAALAARSRGVPLLLVEPNARAGMANRRLSAHAALAAVAFESSAEELRCPARVTGVPVRASFARIPERVPGVEWSLLVLGGSQGATELNSVVPGALALVKKGLEAEIRVVHQAGAGKTDATREGYHLAGVQAVVTEFLDDVPGAMAQADLVLSRSGAITLAEICAASRPSLLFPYPGAESHQRQNAAQLAEQGAAEVVEEPTEELVAECLARLLDHRRLAAMSAAARSLARPEAASDIADLVDELVRAA